MSKKSRRSAAARQAGEIAPATAGRRAELRGGGSLFADARVRRWLPVLGIVVLAFLFLSPVLRGVFIWDDPEWLTENPLVKEPGRLGEIWTMPSASPQYYPLVFTTFWVEYRLWGLGVTGPDGILRGVGYHVDNLLLHILSAVLIFEMLKRLKLPGGVFGAWLSAVVFAIHPVNVESVAWVAERKNTLCGVFFFAAMWAGLRFFRVTEDGTKGPESSRKWEWKFYAAAMLLFVLAMFSKTTAAVLPPVFLLLIWWRRGRISLREIALAAPFFLLAIAFGVLTSFLEISEVGSAGGQWSFSILQRVLIAGTDLWFYIGKLLAPYPVMQIYPRFDIVAGKAVTNWIYYAAPLLYLVLIGVLFGLRKRITRGPVTGVLFFAGALLPALGFINFYTMTFTFVADHYQYLACPGIIVVGMESLLLALKWISARMPVGKGENGGEARARFTRLTTGLATAGLVLTLGVLAYGVSELYTDGVALWGFNVEHNPQNRGPWEGLASARLDHRPADLQGAVFAMEQAAKVSPEEYRVWLALGRYYLGPGNGAKDAGEKGAAYLEKAEALTPERIKAGRAAFLAARAKQLGGERVAGGQYSTTYGPHFQVGAFYEHRGEWDKAIAEFQKDQAAWPENVETYFHAGNCYMGLGDAKNAKIWFERAIEKQPRYAAAWLSLGVCLYSLEDPVRGETAVRRAFSLDPNVVDQFPQFKQLLTQLLGVGRN